MNEKLGRNDLCHCGSGKKYKQCCMSKDKAPRKLKATWVNGPDQEKTAKKMPDLMERTFGNAISAATEEPPTPKDENVSETPPDQEQQQS